MRIVALVKPALVACTAFSLAVAANVARPREAPGVPATPFVGAAPERGGATPLNADSLARVVASRDPFRASRSPAATRFNPDASASGATPPPAIQRPTLSLGGIMMGSEPTALVDGLPGVEGTRVLRVGERVGDFVVRQIAPDRVVIAGRDTTWTLRVRTRFQ